jgi:hypothetical protein
MKVLERSPIVYPFHIFLQLFQLFFNLFNSSVLRNVGSDNHVIIFASCGHFGQEQNRTVARRRETLSTLVPNIRETSTCNLTSGYRFG